MDPVIAKHSQRLAAIPDLEDLTFGVPSGFFWENCSPGIAEAVERALRSLEKAGARLVRFDLSGLDEIFEVFLKGGVAAPELAALSGRNCRTVFRIWIRTWWHGCAPQRSCRLGNISTGWSLSSVFPALPPWNWRVSMPCLRPPLH